MLDGDHEPTAGEPARVGVPETPSEASEVDLGAPTDEDEATTTSAGDPASDPDGATDPDGKPTHERPQKGRPRRRGATRRKLLHQWRDGTTDGVVVLVARTVPEDPDGIHLHSLLPDLDPDRWAEEVPVWEDAELALANTVTGRLLGGRVALAPVRGRFAFAVDVPEIGAFADLRVRYADSARCLAAARATFAADVVRQAPLWRDVRRGRIDPVALAARVRRNLEQLLETEEGGSGAA